MLAPRCVAALSASRWALSFGPTLDYLRRSFSSRDLFIQFAIMKAQKTTNMRTASDSFMLDLQGGLLFSNDRTGRLNWRD